MRIILSILGLLLILVGAVWILQGMSVIGGSVMTGQTQWTVYGIISAAFGIGVLWMANRRRKITQ